ncbi:rab-GTPase-TBC domain-containing protein [Chytriomyces sp. MP71]|nr:rab-GTPase-TBC domain-containing protein [Chytriomyces sp. MP71]
MSFLVTESIGKYSSVPTPPRSPTTPMTSSEPTTVIFNADGSSTAVASTSADDLDDGSDFILARIEASQKETVSPQKPLGITGYLASGFNKFARLGSTSKKDQTEDDSHSDPADDIDWDFWGKIINNYDDMARRQPKLLTKKLQMGIPDSIRGTVWQLMCKGKSEEMEATYRALLTRPSSHEKVIQRDLARTFPKHPHFADAGGPGQESLMNVIKAYSVYDTEVGYCQGIAFVTGPLLLNMPDEEAFCVLVNLMKEYHFRGLYTPNMVGLQLRLYQFERLLAEMFPAVSKHFEANDIKPTMYASQWFMTVFAYRFPLEIVFRILDTIFAQGLESIFRFSFALLKKNQAHLLSLTDMQALLDFLKNGLFDVYVDNVNALMQDAAAVHISKSKFDRLAAEHEMQLARTNPELLSGDALRAENRRLTAALKKCEEQYEVLNKEHIELVKEHIEMRTVKERVEMKVEEHEITVEGLKSVLSSERKEAEEQVKDEMERLAHKNFALTTRNEELQDRLDRVEVLLHLEATVKTLRGN